MANPDETSTETRDADESDARATHRADRPPTPEEAAAAERNQLDPDVAEAYEEAAERGAHVQGEGQI